jgi:hypothetical protein
MKNTIKLFAFVGVLLLAQACEKETTPEPTPPAAVVGTLVGCDYWPYKVGSTVTYQREDESTYVINCNKEVTAEGHLWIESTSTLSATHLGYYRCDSLFGYLRQPNPGTSNYITTRHVKINGAVDDTWTDVITTNDIDSHYEHQIIEIDKSYEVLGVTYTDVMMVDIVASTEYNGTMFPFSFYTEYFSKHAGLIHSTLSGASIKIKSHNF